MACFAVDTGYPRTRGPVWITETLDRIVRDHAEFREKCGCIRNNPVKVGLCPVPEGRDALYGATANGNSERSGQP